MSQDTDYKPSINHIEHRSLEDRVKSYLEENGFLVCESTYHSVLPEMIVSILKRRFSMTALYLRGRADRIAIHKNNLYEFEFEVKTHANKKYNDLLVEMLPLVHHIHKSKLGVRCLYAFKVNGFEGGFWTHKPPDVRQIHIPPRKEYEPTTWFFENIASKFFPGVPVYKTYTGGSADPFVIFDSSIIKELNHWQDLIYSENR